VTLGYTIAISCCIIMIWPWYYCLYPKICWNWSAKNLKLQGWFI